MGPAITKNDKQQRQKAWRDRMMEKAKKAGAF